LARKDRYLLDGFEESIPPATVMPWLQPYPDDLVDNVVARETVELAFLAALQFVPSKQRAAFILRDVLCWSAQDCAELLGVSVDAINSVVQPVTDVG
jgi:RNA polymerase sigma-70 factor (ECF subfamily)